MTDTIDPFAGSDDVPNVGPIFPARFDSECETCGAPIEEGDQIRLVDGWTECELCIEENKW